MNEEKRNFGCKVWYHQSAARKKQADGACRDRNLRQIHSRERKLFIMSSGIVILRAFKNLSLSNTLKYPSSRLIGATHQVCINPTRMGIPQNVRLFETLSF